MLDQVMGNKVLTKDGLLEKVEQLQSLLIERATNNPQADEIAYKDLRQTVMDDKRIVDLLPEFVTQCRTLGQFWGFIKGQSGQWQPRRQVIWNAFGPLMNAIEKLPDGREAEASEFDIQNPEVLVNTLARLLAAEGAAAAVAALTFSKPSIEWIENDRLYGDVYRLYLRVPARLFAQFGEGRKEVESAIATKFYPLLAPYTNATLRDAVIVSELTHDPEWRDKAGAWLAGKNVTNQVGSAPLI